MSLMDVCRDAIPYMLDLACVQDPNLGLEPMVESFSLAPRVVPFSTYMHICWGGH